MKIARHLKDLIFTSPVFSMKKRIENARVIARRKQREHGRNERRIIITGQMRSGTTMMAGFLNAQKDITVLADCLRIPAASEITFRSRVDPEARLTRNHRNRLLRTMADMALSDPTVPEPERLLFEEWKSNPSIVGGVENQLDLYLALCDCLERRNETSEMFGTKITRGEMLAWGLARYGVKAIIMLRDPRAVFTSQAERAKKDNFITVNIDRFIREWRRSFEIWHSASGILPMRYEDFVASDSEFDRLSRYLGRELDRSVRIPTLNTPFNDKFTGKRRTEPLDRWKRLGEPATLKRICDELGAQMKIADYDPDP